MKPAIMNQLTIRLLSTLKNKRAHQSYRKKANVTVDKRSLTNPAQCSVQWCSDRHTSRKGNKTNDLCAR